MIAAIVFAARYQVSGIGLALIAISIGLFVLEFGVKISWVAGLSGAAILPAGFTYLFAGPERISKLLAIPLGMLLGIVTALVCNVGKRARLNKSSDL